MKTKAIIETILRTRELDHTLIGLAAVCAESGDHQAIVDVQNFWIRQGGTVDERSDGLKEPVKAKA